MPSVATNPITGAVKTKTIRIDSDLSAKAYHAVDYDASDANVVNLVEDGNTQGFILIEGADGSSNETVGTIALSGRTKVKLVGTVAAGDHLAPSTGGACIKNVTDTKFTCAVAQEAGVTGDIISVEAIQGTLSV